jgi:hypothetical protein
MAIVNIKPSTSHGPTTLSFRPELTTFGLSTTKRPTFLSA